MNNKFFRLLTVAITILFMSCEKKESQPTEFQPDYQSAHNWIVTANGSSAKDVDLFFFIPTSWIPTKTDGLFCNIDNASLRKKAPAVVSEVAGVFAESCNLYAPYYRQINIDSITNLTSEELYNKVGDVPYNDAVSAFKYYLKHYNNGRPFILASHSQGSQIGALLMRRFLHDNPEVQKRMIAAYLIGYTINRQDTVIYKNMHEARTATDLGKIICWNTETADMTGESFIVTGNGMCINPINWRTDDTYASASESKGSNIKENGVYVRKDHFADARVNTARGSLIISTITSDFWNGLPTFPKGCLHGLDYPLYYFDIQHNVADRIAAWKRQNR